MSVRVDGDRIFLEGECGVEDAEALAAVLEASPSMRVDIASCRLLHSAVVQALLAFRPELEGPSADRFVNEFVLPSLSEKPIT